MSCMAVYGCSETDLLALLTAPTAHPNNANSALSRLMRPCAMLNSTANTRLQNTNLNAPPSFCQGNESICGDAHQKHQKCAAKPTEFNSRLQDGDVNLVGHDTGVFHEAVQAQCPESPPSGSGGGRRFTSACLMAIEFLVFTLRLQLGMSAACSVILPRACALARAAARSFISTVLFQNVGSIDLRRTIARTEPDGGGKKKGKGDDRYVPTFAGLGQDRSDQQASGKRQECEADHCSSENGRGQERSAHDQKSPAGLRPVDRHQGEDQKSEAGREIGSGRIESENQRFARRPVPLVEELLGGEQGAQQER